MKKFIFLLIAFLLSLTACTKQHSWEILTPFEGGKIYYFISKTAHAKDSAAIRWGFDEPQNLIREDNSSVTYTIKEATIIFDCLNGTFIMPDYSYHNKSTIVHWVSESPNEIRNAEIKSDAVISALLNKVAANCAH